MTTINDLNGSYVIDPSHSTISFVARHAMVTKVRGSFKEFSGQAVVDQANLANSTLEVSIDPASVNTRNADRDAHLKGPDFFDVEKFPAWSFKGTGFEIKGNVVEVTGDLTIKETTRQITIPLEFQGAAKDIFGNNRVGFEGTQHILRSDFGLTWNAALETGGFLVSDKITMEFEISAIVGE